MDSQLLHRTLTKMIWTVICEFSISRILYCVTQLKLYTKLRQAECSTNMLSVLFYKRCCSYSLLVGRHVSWSPQRKWSQRHSPGSSKSSSNLQSLTSSPPDEAPASMVRDFGFWMDFWLLVTYNNENQKEDKKGQEDELSSALFPHFLFCLNSFYFFFCHVHSDNEGWKEKVLIPAIQWACDNCHRWHDPPSCSARLPSNWPRSQDPWRPHGSRWSPAPSSSYPRVWRGKKVPRRILWV